MDLQSHLQSLHTKRHLADACRCHPSASSSFSAKSSSIVAHSSLMGCSVRLRRAATPAGCLAGEFDGDGDGRNLQRGGSAICSRRDVEGFLSCRLPLRPPPPLSAALVQSPLTPAVGQERELQVPEYAMREEPPSYSSLQDDAADVDVHHPNPSYGINTAPPAREPSLHHEPHCLRLRQGYGLWREQQVPLLPLRHLHYARPPASRRSLQLCSLLALPVEAVGITHVDDDTHHSQHPAAFATLLFGFAKATSAQTLTCSRRQPPQQPT
jgi:hypothetical protein